MIEIPIHNAEGKQVDSLQIDERLLGGELRPILLKQAYVHFHANRRQGSASTRNRSQVEGSTRKLFKQKGTGNARRGPSGTNIMRGGGHAFAKEPKSWRQQLPKKMRRLANRNALLAKVVDGELKLLEKLTYDKPSTKQFAGLLDALEMRRSCLVAFSSCTGNEARSASNLENVTVTLVDQLNVFDILNHRYLLAEKDAFEAWVKNIGSDAAMKEAS